MVAYNITLNDISPMIQYTGSWIDKHEDGPFLPCRPLRLAGLIPRVRHQDAHVLWQELCRDTK